MVGQSDWLPMMIPILTSAMRRLSSADGPAPGRQRRDYSQARGRRNRPRGKGEGQAMISGSSWSSISWMRSFSCSFCFFFCFIAALFKFFVFSIIIFI